MLPFFLNPLSVFRVLDEIDREPPSHSADRQSGSRRALIVLFSVSVSLLALNYLKFASTFNYILEMVASWQGLPSAYWLNTVRATGFEQLLQLTWWTFCHAITFVLIPVIVIKCFFKERVLDYGWRWGETHKHWQGYLVLLSPILLFVVLASYRDDFVHHYPFYREAGRSWLDFGLWEVVYLAQFAFLEFFFRGFIVKALRPNFGSAAIWIMIVPYMMIHLPKPWLEATGSIFFGLFLGILALRSRSIWGGFCVHAGVAVGMDIASLIQQNAIPNKLLPF